METNFINKRIKRKSVLLFFSFLLVLFLVSLSFFSKIIVEAVNEPKAGGGEREIGFQCPEEIPIGEAMEETVKLIADILAEVDGIICKSADQISASKDLISLSNQCDVGNCSPLCQEARRTERTQVAVIGDNLILTQCSIRPCSYNNSVDCVHCIQSCGVEHMPDCGQNCRIEPCPGSPSLNCKFCEISAAEIGAPGSYGQNCGFSNCLGTQTCLFCDREIVTCQTRDCEGSPCPNEEIELKFEEIENLRQEISNNADRIEDLTLNKRDEIKKKLDKARDLIDSCSLTVTEWERVEKELRDEKLIMSCETVLKENWPRKEEECKSLFNFYCCF